MARHRTTPAHSTVPPIRPRPTRPLPAAPPAPAAGQRGLTRAARYARVATAKQARAETVASQVDLLSQAAAQRLTENLMRLARRYYAGRAGIGSTDAGSASPETAADANLFGTPEEVVERIHFLRENFSADEIMFEVNWTASVPRDVVMHTMRLITDKVIPQFK